MQLWYLQVCLLSIKMCQLLKKEFAPESKFFPLTSGPHREERKKNENNRGTSLENSSLYLKPLSLFGVLLSITSMNQGFMQ